MLVLIDDPAAEQAAPGVAFTWLEIAGLDQTVSRRGLGIVELEAGADLARGRATSLKVFEPITTRRISPHGLDN